MDSTTVRILVDDAEDEVSLPEGVFDLLAEESPSRAKTAGDLLVLDIAHRLHSHVHHAQGETDDAVAELDSAMQEHFEKRFGASFAEVTGHQH